MRKKQLNTSLLYHQNKETLKSELLEMFNNVGYQFSDLVVQPFFFNGSQSGFVDLALGSQALNFGFGVDSSNGRWFLFPDSNSSVFPNLALPSSDFYLGDFSFGFDWDYGSGTHSIEAGLITYRPALSGYEVSIFTKKYAQNVTGAQMEPSQMYINRLFQGVFLRINEIALGTGTISISMNFKGWKVILK